MPKIWTCTKILNSGGWWEYLEELTELSMVPFFSQWKIKAIYYSPDTYFNFANWTVKCSSLLSAIRVVPSAYLRLLIFLLAILIASCLAWRLHLYPAWRFGWCTLHINSINRVTTYSLDILLSQFGTSLLLHVQLLLLDMPADFSSW